MEVLDYQEKAHTFARYGEGEKDSGFNKYVYPVLGLTEEAGEVAGKFAKAYRDCDGVIDETRKQEICKEIGDVCWMLAEICSAMNVKLSDVMQMNIDKLTDRAVRNVIKGNGDNR